MMKRLISAGIIALFLILCFTYSIKCPQPVGKPTEREVADISDESISNEFSIEKYKENHPKVRGIYVTGPTAGTERMDDIIKLINDTELNAIVLDVKD
ncbi:MAG: sugar fermentation stimulation protein, partial [Pseudobutyrivibrio sp.]|uniref:putative glycoside hydrolase n=1 Tax=Pseudobutyrivibrio sp. TaxID=2014367 RepID=UPI0025E3C894